jgi:formylglycine-generating enzyme required for sulfatase activity
MLAGAPPIDAADRIMEDDLKSIKQLVPGVSSQLNDALIKALAVKTEDRPQSIKEFQDMLVKDREHLFEPASQQAEIDDAIFDFAKNLGTQKALNLYLEQFPEGIHTNEAENILLQIENKNKATGKKKPERAGKLEKNVKIEHREKEEKKDKEEEQREKQPEESKVKPVDKKETDTEEEDLLIEYELTFEYKTKNSGVIVSTGALNRQGKEGVLVWEDDAYIKDKLPRVYRNEKGFWEINLINRASLDFDLIMIYVPAGEFLMGSDERDAEPDELPVHNVFLHGFWMGKYEVTFKQFDLFCQETGLYINQNAVSDNKRPSDAGWGREERPVINVSWNDTQGFCRWVSGKTGLLFHLPSEAQWEKAARGTDYRRYSWGDRPPVKRLVNFKDSSIGKTVQVAQFPGGASPYGIMDMSGNVWEWCNDWYSEDYYKTSPGSNPKGPEKGLTRVKRGGSWDVNEKGIRCSYRNSSYVSYRDYNLGFRLVMEG